MLLQYAINDGLIQIVHLWKVSICESMRLIEMFVNGRVVAHNLRFDWWHLSKWYNMCYWLLTKAHVNEAYCPEDLSIGLMAEAEWHSQYGPCLKPKAAIDTMLLASKSERQSFLMDMKSTYVRRVPIGLSDAICAELNKVTDLPWILFAGKKKESEKGWVVVDNKDQHTGEIDPYWKDIKLSFKPSKGLKDLAVFLCGHKPSKKFEEIAPNKMPVDEGFAPFVVLLSSEKKEWLYPVRKKLSNGQYRIKLMETWPAIIKEHIEHWASNLNAKDYAEDDIHMLRKLYVFFGSPEEDEDGMVACQVASVRLRGFDIDIPGVKKLKIKSQKIVDTAELNVNSTKQVAGYVAEALDPMEQLILKAGCDQKVIDSIKIEFTLDEEEECYCENGKIHDTENDGTKQSIDIACKRCEGCGTVGPGPMPVVRRVKHIEEVRKHTKRIELFNKLLLSGRAYPDFNVIGTKSGRMSGASGLNFQGIDHSDDVRSLFTLAGPSQGLWEKCPHGTQLVLSAGDYESQELAIAATAMRDAVLMEDMASGKKLHGLFAAELFETTYEDIMENQESDPLDRYKKGKSGVFLTLYGGTFETLARNIGIEVEIAEAAYNRLCAKYPQMGNTRKRITERFASMHQDIDKRIEYRDPPEKWIESVFGYKRYFETEYSIQRMILSVIKNMPEKWKKIEVKVERTEGKIQSISGALCSALYGAAFSIQNKIIRAANNHIIQSTGRHLTVGMQAAVWKVQPQGIHPYRLTLMSIHDELAIVSPENVVEDINQVIEAKVGEQCETVPLTCINWFNGNKSWAEKGDGANGQFFGWKP